jgi:hypothetical protein
MRPNLVLLVTAFGLSLLPLFATSGLAQTTASQPAIIHMIYHDAQVTGKTTTTSTIEDRHVLASAEVHGNKVTLVFDSSACEVYESGVHTNKGCNRDDSQGDLKAQSKYSPRVNDARNENAHATRITFTSLAKAAAFRNLMLSTPPPVLEVTAADTRIDSNNIFLKPPGTKTYVSFEDYVRGAIAQAQVPSEAQNMMKTITMDPEPDVSTIEKQPSVYNKNRPKGGGATDASKPDLSTVPIPMPAGHF